MHQTTNIISFNDLLSFLCKDDLKCFMNDRRLLKILKTSDCALQDNQAQLEDIQSPLRFEISRLRYGALHKVLLRHIHFEDAKSHHTILGDFLRSLKMINRVRVDIGKVIIKPHS